MPYYDYRCRKCNHTVERKMGIREEHPNRLDEPCPVCEAVELERALSRSGFVLQGQGWARDGYT